MACAPNAEKNVSLYSFCAMMVHQPRCETRQAPGPKSAHRCAFLVDRSGEYWKKRGRSWRKVATSPQQYLVPRLPPIVLPNPATGLVLGFAWRMSIEAQQLSFSKYFSGQPNSLGVPSFFMGLI